MAITKQVTNEITSVREQTWRINFEIPADGTPSIQTYRESVPLDAEGNTVGASQQSYTAINRTFDEAADDIVTLGDGSELTFGDVVEAMALLGDQWAEEDAAQPATQMKE